MKLERWDIKWCVNYRPRFRRRIGIYFGIWAGSWEKWRDLGCRGTKGCSPGRGFLSTDTRDWLCARGRMPFSRHVRDVCLRRTGMKSSDKLRWDEWEEFRQDRSHPQYRGHLLLPCTPRKKKKKKKKPILRRGNAEGEDRRGGGGGIGGGKIVGIVIRWRL